MDDPAPGSPPDARNEARDEASSDPWDNDPWKRDAWKEADWGEPAKPAPEGGRRSAGPGITSWSGSMIEAGPYLTLGLQSAFAMAFFVGIGYLVDGWLGSRPWGMIVGAAVGMVGVITLLTRLAKQANAESAARRAAEDDTSPSGT